MNVHSITKPAARKACQSFAFLDGIASPTDLRNMPRSALPQLSDELRQEIVQIVSQTGGHLGAGLGVIELTIALHYAFDTPQDKLIWDVSHQCYPHKVLTGRRAGMRRIRQGGGLSGFTSRKESAFDPFGAAHSSTAVSAALGYAAARDLEGGNNAVIAIVGDGAISGGMAYEGLNNLGAQRRRMIVVLNDNNMSIAPPSGALVDYFAKLRARMPEADQRAAAIDEHRLPSFVDEETLFDDLGLRYAGPFDGHNVDELVKVFEAARAYDGPLLLHVVTEKGKGYAPAASSDDKYHGVSKFDIETGQQHKGTAKAPSYTSVFAQALINEATADEKVVAVTAAMPSGTGLDRFGKAFPDRCFDAGIAEQHAVTFCAGLACEGFRPFAAIYSTFLQRAFDQIVHDVAIQRLPVRFAIDRAGMVGADGVTHQGSYDITYLACLPDFVVMAAANEVELVRMVATAAQIDDRPSAFRYPRGEATGLELPETAQPLEIGKGRIVREGTSVAILSYGARLAAALEAAGQLSRIGLSTTVADARFAKPIDDRLVARLVRDHAVVVTLEEGAIGGFSSQVMDSMRRQRMSDAMARIVPMYLPDAFIDHDAPALQVARAELDAKAIVMRVTDALRFDDVTLQPVRVVAAE